jgi:hypothetical protein
MGGTICCHLEEVMRTGSFDGEGHGRSWQDLKDLFVDVRNGIVFSAAFEDRLRISLSEYEDRFFDLMHTYLD